MQIVVNGNELRGDLIRFAALRSDAVPVPCTLEAEIRIDDSIKDALDEGKAIHAGKAMDPFYIIKSVRALDRNSQGQHHIEVVKIIALLESCHQIAFVRNNTVLKENATLSQIYRACGASLKSIDADFPVDRFSCYVGETPSFHISRVLQENGGIVRWKNGRMKYFRLQDLFKQEPVLAIPDNASHDINSGFSERHHVQFFYSVDPTGALIYGNRNKARSARFMPFMNEMQLRNLTRCLVQRKIFKHAYDENICAGDLINVVGKPPLVVVTAAHVAVSGTDGVAPDQYTRLWLSSLEE